MYRLKETNIFLFSCLFVKPCAKSIDDNRNLSASRCRLEHKNDNSLEIPKNDSKNNKVDKNDDIAVVVKKMTFAFHEYLYGVEEDANTQNPKLSFSNKKSNKTAQ